MEATKLEKWQIDALAWAMKPIADKLREEIREKAWQEHLKEMEAKGDNQHVDTDTGRTE